MLIAPVPGPPHILIPTAIISAVASLWSLFRGGVSENIKQALEGLRYAIAQTADTLMRFAWQITRALGKLLSALHTIWTRVIWPVLRNLPRALGRLRRLIERDLPRLLRLINRIRERLIEMYERFWRPVLINIQRIRRMLVILRLFRVRWAGQLDARLAGLQEQIMRPLRIALEHIAMVEQWINAIITAEQLLQEAVLHNSLWHYQGSLVRAWWAGMTTGDGAGDLALARKRPSEYPAEQSRAEIRQYLSTGTGPLAERAREWAADLWALMGRG